MSILTYNVIKVFFLTAISSLLAFFVAPILIRFLNKTQFWKKEARRKTISGQEADVFYSLHKEKEINTPRAGGLLIWLAVTMVMLVIFILSRFTEIWWLEKLNFLSRGETWLPLFTIIVASLVGLLDDFMVVSNRGKYVGGGLEFWRRILVVALIGIIGGCWFYFKLDWSTVHIPFIFNFPEGINLDLGLLIIPFFAFVMVACFSGGIIDGIDGLSGGVFATIFGAFSVIAFSLGKVDLAAFCGAIVGALFAFLWFNIPPAKFYMGETGALGLTTTMAVVAFLTDSVAVLPLIAGVMVLEVLTVIFQLLSKKFRHKKIWLSTPFHHHLEAIGWPHYQISMRFWLISMVLAILGTAIRLMSR